MESILFYKALPYVVMAILTIGAVSSGALVCLGLTSQSERIQTRLRFKKSLSEQTDQFVTTAKRSSAEEMFKKAGYPMRINGVRYYIIYFSLLAFLLMNYVVLPLLINGHFSLLVLAKLILLIVFFLLWIPSFPISLFRFVMKRVQSYQEAKKNTEIFMLYDLIINEIEMMTVTRLNTYNMIRGLKNYFIVINLPIARLLTNWSNDEGPMKALDMFAAEIDTKEAKSIVSVLKTLDNVDRETALKQLRGMNNMFVRSQIENYRRRRKVTTDLATIPIKTTHFIIALNFLAVVAYMVKIILESSRG